MSNMFEDNDKLDDEVVLIEETSDPEPKADERYKEQLKDEIPKPRYLRGRNVREPFAFWEDSADTNFNVSSVADRLTRDYQYFRKFQKYTSISRNINDPEHCWRRVSSPSAAAHLYERQYWNLTLFDKFCRIVKKRVAPLNSSPFTSEGISRLFEKETLYSPQRCPIYILRSRELSVNNLKRFFKAMRVTHADVYDELSLDEIHTEETILDFGKFLRKGATPRKVSKPKPEPPVANIDRNAWPSELEVI